MKTRLPWIDQARGFSIFLVVYGHNFPQVEPYIYSFHVPLFFMISGFFHPTAVGFKAIRRRFTAIMTPYFVWSLLLFLFWFFLGRQYGLSQNSGYTATDNFIGIFYAQGGAEYMEWGIPMWFLPCIFLVYLIYSAINRLNNRLLRSATILLVVCAGFLWAQYTQIHLPWSLDVAMVAIAFYSCGALMSKPIKKLSFRQTAVIFPVFLAIGVLAFLYNPLKVDMYRSIYGNPSLFLASGIAGSIACILLFKLVPVFGFLSYIGKHTIVILATHLRAMTLIKAFLVFALGWTLQEFSEAEKLLYSILQILVLIPLIWLVNNYIPILDGKIKKT